MRLRQLTPKTHTLSASNGCRIGNRVLKKDLGVTFLWFDCEDHEVMGLFMLTEQNHQRSLEELYLHQSSITANNLEALASLDFALVSEKEIKSVIVADLRQLSHSIR